MNTNSVRFFQEKQVKPVSQNCELILTAWEIKNPSNLGQIIRLAHNVGAVKVYFITDDPNYRESKIKKTAGFSFDQMNWKFISEEKFFAGIEEDQQLVVLETCSGSENIFETKLPGKTIILAGNESHGLPPQIIQKSKKKIFIPMPGGCKSMNISHALAVASFEWYRQQTV
jgi:tRNA G18 (ribose-2'-O)-methylase SpoU